MYREKLQRDVKAKHVQMFAFHVPFFGVQIEVLKKLILAYSLSSAWQAYEFEFRNMRLLMFHRIQIE